jgi:hypothetical protein
MLLWLFHADNRHWTVIEVTTDGRVRGREFVPPNEPWVAHERTFTAYEAFATDIADRLEDMLR